MKLKLLIAFASSVLTGSVAEAGDNVHWNYSGMHGPEHWGSLSEDFSACIVGKNQSPIDIKGTFDAVLPDLRIAYQTSQLRVINNGHTLQVNYEPGSTIEVDGITFELKQFHFHTPSENHINGKSYPLEAHLVHADKAGNLAVIGVMFEDGKENEFVKLLWKHMPMTPGPEKILTERINISELLPTSNAYYRFSGSLTTPPCSEGVRWIVMKMPLSASSAQIAVLSNMLKHPNNRPVQKVNARVILE